MSWENVLGWAEVALFACLFLFAWTTPLREGNRRAALRGGLATFPLAAGWTSFLLLLPGIRTWLSLGMAVAITAFLLAFFLPWGRPEGIRIVAEQERVDERDVIFSRMALPPGSPEYRRYYSRRPQLEPVDRRLRSLPPLGQPGGRYYAPEATPLANACFDLLREAGKLTTAIDPQGERLEITGLTFLIKGMARYLGADLVGVAELEEAYVYSHRGRVLSQHGEPVELPHRYAVVIGVEMDWHAVVHAPSAITLMESARQYVEAAKVALILARYLRLLGFSAQPHIDANYRVLVVPLAWKAGLGELGRLNYLLTPQFGPRVRWSVVTTDAPLEPDRPLAFGIQDLCCRCLKCATNCPARAISSGEKELIRGVERWGFVPERCYAQWLAFGTDCGICMRVCPLSHPPIGLHRLFRWAVPRSPVARQLLVWWDDLIYGRRLRLPAASTLPRPWWPRARGVSASRGTMG